MDNFNLDALSEKLKTGKIALLDADFIKYEVCSIYKKKIVESGLEERRYISENPIQELLESYLFNVIFKKIDDPIIFCFSGKSFNTFRAFVSFDKEYKGNRKIKEESYHGEYNDSILIVKYFTEKYATLIFADLEADDIVSALQNEYTYIYSKDKDLKQVPGFHYDFEKNEIYEITNKDAIYNLSMQLLMGDSTDNISGFPGIGEVGAKKFLSEVVDSNGNIMHSQFIYQVLKAYQKKFGVFKGTDMFVEAWNLVKTRIERGEYFLSKYKKMYDTREYFINVIKAVLK